jgi:hypothetical protein
VIAAVFNHPAAYAFAGAYLVVLIFVAWVIITSKPQQP